MVETRVRALRVLVSGWPPLTDLWPPLPQHRSVTFQKVKAPFPGARQAWWLGWWWGRGLSGQCQEGQAQPVNETDTSQSDPESCDCKGVQEELAVWWG